MVTTPGVESPPPDAAAWLLRNTELSRITSPCAEMPPPLPVASPPVMVRFWMVSTPVPVSSTPLSAHVWVRVKPWPSTATGAGMVRSSAPPPPVQSASVMSLLNSTNPSLAKAVRSSASVETDVALAGSDVITPHPTAVTTASAPIETTDRARDAADNDRCIVRLPHRLRKGA
jgi:hypothetical protein